MKGRAGEREYQPMFVTFVVAKLHPHYERPIGKRDSIHCDIFVSIRRIFLNQIVTLSTIAYYI